LQANAFDLGSAHFTMGGMLNGASGGPPTTGVPCRWLGGFGSGGGQAGSSLDPATAVDPSVFADLLSSIGL